MKKQLLLLVSILLPLISSCNHIPTAEPTVEPTIEPTVEPTFEPTVEPSEEIYYLDGLASNLFVTEVPDNVRCIYLEDSDSYIACAQTKMDGTVYKNIDCIIPNVYDDGINGLKRIKYFQINYYGAGYYNKLVLSEGIEFFYASIGEIPTKEIYFPSTTKMIKSLFYGTVNVFNKEEHGNIEKVDLYYNGTVEQFGLIEPIPPYVCVSDHPFEVEFICLDGVAYFEFYEGVYGCAQG